MKKVYSDAHHQYKPEAYSLAGATEKQREEAANAAVLRPAVTLLGITTPRQFCDREVKKWCQTCYIWTT